MKLHIFGASGSGTTTLGNLLSEEYGWPIFDADDYYWKKTEIPFTEKNTTSQRHKLLLNDLEDKKSWIMTGSMDSWCEPFKPLWNLAILVESDDDIRVQRLRDREFKEFGKRIHAGGDMYDEHELFIKWAKQYEDGSLGGRSRDRHEKFIQNLTCPVLRIKNNRRLSDFKKEAIGLINEEMVLND